MKFDSNLQKKISSIIGDSPSLSDWHDYKWHLKHSVNDIATFEKLSGIKFSDEEKKEYEKVLNIFPLSITPYYLSLIDADNYKNDPVFRQSFPMVEELNTCRFDMEDPLHEDEDSPIKHLTHRYPDRVLLMVSNVCSMYCRHCTRKRRVSDVDSIPSKDELKNAIDYIRNTPEIRDVLLSGGDPLMLNDDYLDWLLSEISSIEHVEIIRIGTRMPVVLPYRITDSLIEVLKKHSPIWLNTHFNHPREITRSAKKSLAKLADAGIVLGNQSVLLAGVNDCPRIMRTLVHKLVANRVRPYYMYQCDLTTGLTHFRTPIGKGIEIIENLIGHTSGFAVPTYVVDAPGGGGKIPVMPNYLISWSTNKVVLRNYEGVITTYKEPDSYEEWFCDRDCAKCSLTLNLEEASEITAVGIQKLLADANPSISLTPENTKRLNRRDE